MISFVEKVSILHQQWFQRFATQVFDNCPSALAAITSAFTGYLNSSPIFGCLLSVYVHQYFLSLYDCKVILLLNDAIVLFNFIEEKPAISEYARYFLCNRILRQLTKDPEEDVTVIGKTLDQLQVDSPISVKLILKDYKKSLQKIKDEIIPQNGRPFEVSTK